MGCQHAMSRVEEPHGVAHLVRENFGRFRPLVAINANADLVEDLDYGTKVGLKRRVSDDSGRYFNQEIYHPHS